nr:zinc finger, CCHC-type [Tanacetum cinerariifolium]
MDVAAIKHMASNCAKLDKFEGVDFQRWQKNMHFLLSSITVVYVLTTPSRKDEKNAIMKQIRKRNKWGNDDYVCRGLILNGMSDSLFDIYQNIESSKELWDSLEAKYMAEDASCKKFLVSNFINYKMTDSRPVMEQYNELLDFKHTLKQNKEELTLVELGNHLHIEESLRVQDSDKPKENNVIGPLVSFRYNDNKGKHKHQDTKGRFSFRRTSLTGFLAQSISSSNTIALDLPNLLVLITGMSQSRQQDLHIIILYAALRSCVTTIMLEILKALLTISPSTYALPLDRFDNNVSFEEELVYQRLQKTLTHVLELSSCIYLDDRAWGLEF